MKGQGDFNPPSETRRTNSDQKEAAPTGTELQQLNNNSNIKAKVEETVNTISNRLKERRRELGLPDSVKVSRNTFKHINYNIGLVISLSVFLTMHTCIYLWLFVQEMSHFQMTLEKTSLQKCLLHFEGLHGRPVRLSLMSFN